ncbi:MAG TPA: glycoside hydrolase family 3 N-terminal domain-containing protein [Candidatus Saccharimonadales bacterium]|nr:glycoside hydrolase family 3 N-terminal domain-containing protein [Candidatus Saccharimonadales bacterium]
MSRTVRFSLVLLMVSVLVFGTASCSMLKNLGNDTTSTPCDWTLDRLAAQVVVVPVDQSDLAAGESAVAAGAGGILLFGKTPSNIRVKIADLVKHAPKGDMPLVMADQEGGAVQRLSGLVSKLNSARWMADHWSTEKIQGTSRVLGGQMKELGVTMDLAPVLDLDAQATAPNSMNADGNRSFGIDPVKTTRAGLAFARGLQDAGVTPVVKHFPGLGGTVGNTDDRPAHTLPWEQLQKAGVRPFKAAIDAGMPAVMTANASVPGLTDLPASISPEVMKYLRQQLGFKGMIITDSLSAKALLDSGYSPQKAVVAALKAGADMLLYGTSGVSVSEYGSVTAATVEAVNQGQLTRERLVQAVNAVRAVKHLGACGS